MENASKALIMAGGVLIGILIIGLIVVSYRQLAGLANTEHQKEVVNQQKNYNAQWEKYNGTIYGTDVLSMVNQMEDYNKTQAENDGYAYITAKIAIKQEVKSTEVLSNSTEVKRIIPKVELKKNQYTAENMYTILKNIEEAIEKIKKIKIEGKTISSLASMRVSDLKNHYGDAKAEEIQKETLAYKEVVELYKEIKSKKFKASLKYDDITGRITEIQVEE